MLIRRWTWWLFFGLFGMNLSLTAQKKNLAKYPSLLWEITGNGLKKPSYLFGTMHVSNKMAFHLSDSFYAALKSVDAVALELNPELWQRQMVQLELHKAQYAEYTAAFETEYFDENSFRIKKYDEVLKTALHTEPTAVNSLLYRSYKNSEDFEEDTFLDLYIFQTGRKLGKRASGVENYYETEQIILEAYAEMAKEKKLQADNETPDYPEDYEQKLQEAYRNGNLDVFDSLDIVTERSKAFREKFLYKRNEIQANSIDTIVQKSALFVGVGASHLPGERGVIELLRKKGYQLRPIKMANRDAVARENINRLKVPVTFTETKAADGFYSVAVPGKMYQLNEGQFPCDRWQYADMSNGAYYLVTRIKTHATFIGETEKDVLKRVDSFLYENIPGKIISKKSIIKNGYNGVDISNRTRRGDVQRHQIFITPFEILIFKMNGSENYVVGSEAEQFFNSIQLKPISNKATNFSPGWGGFSINFPHAPSENLNKYCTDAIPRWEYEAIDKTSGDTYMLLKKSLYGLTYMEADSFELQLVEESFESPQFFDRQLKREWITEKNNTILEIVEKLKDSSIVKARLFNIGADYYILAIKGKKEQPGWTNFFNSFVALDYTYPNKQTYVDTFYHFSVQTPVQPLIDPIYRAKIEKTTSEMLRSDEPEKNYWPNVKTVHFKNENTGEKITIGIRKYPQYYSISDTLQFWKDELKHYSNYGDYHLLKTDTLAAKNGCLGYCFYFTDTATSTILMRQSMIKDNYLYNVLALTDSAGIRNDFIQHFYSSFTPLSVPGSQSIFTSKMDSFYTHFTSKDSTIKSTTRKLIPYITYGKKGVPTLLKSMQSLSANDADYFDIKSKLIDELGYINDPSNAIILPILEQLYVAVGDTTVFKNALLAAFAHQQTKASFQQFKKYILADPPIFENEDEYSNLLLSLNDSIQHAAAIFPDILELTALDDYKAPIMNLLIKGVDSGYILPHQYEPYFSKILFNAKIELKKQWAKEEKIQGNAYKLKPNNAERNYENVFEKTKLDEYAALLIPFYDEQAQVQSFFSKLLQFKNGNIQRNTIALMLSKDKPVADSLVERIAANDLTRGILYTLFEKHGITNKFPAAFKQQLLLAKSYLLNDKNYNAVDSIELISTQQIQSLNKLGRVYFFKYRIKKSDDWKIGISGMQPLSLNEVSSDFSFCKMTDKKIKDTEPLLPQFQKQLKIMLYEKRKSALEFYKEENDNQYKNYND